MNKFIALGIFVGCGAVGTGIYFAIPLSSRETQNIQEDLPLLMKQTLTQEQQEIYKSKYKEKFPDLELLEYSNYEAWKEANKRLAGMLVHYPEGLRYQEAGKTDEESTRDWCYSIATRDWKEEKFTDDQINETVSKICQVPKVIEGEDRNVRDEEGEDFDNLQSVGSQDL